MLQITFGEIDAGWAETTLDFGTEQPVKIQISFFSDPFLDLANWTTGLLRGDASGEVAFTDEYDNWFLSFQWQPEGVYTLRLEQWTPWSVNIQRNQGKLLESWHVTDLEPWEFGFQMWSELKRVQNLPAVLNWIDDDAGRLPDGKHNHARAVQIAELEKTLSG